MPETLSKAAEQKIIDGAKTAIDLVDDGMTPDAAMAKVARDAAWGPHMIRLASYAYNTGRQTAQREESDGALAKFAEFPLVDPEKVVADIFPSQAKAAHDLGVAADYQLPPRWLADREQTQKAASAARFEKTASAKAAAQPKPAPVFSQVYTRHCRLKQAAERAAVNAAGAYERLTQEMGKLENYFGLWPTDRIKFADAATGVRAYYGPAGMKLLDWAYTSNGLKEAKAADGRLGRGKLLAVDRTAAPYVYVKASLDAAAEVLRLQAAEKTAQAVMEKHALDELAPLVARKRITKQASDSLIPDREEYHYDLADIRHFVPAREQPTVKQAAAPAEWSLLTGEPEKTAEGNGGFVGTGMADLVGGKTKDLLNNAFAPTDPGSKLNDAYMKLDDPAHDAELRQIQSQALLTDLMNDDVIGSYDPDEVLRAYNEISQLSPRTALQPLAMRSLLRQHLQGNVGPHEVGQVSDLEKGVMGSQAAPPSPTLVPSWPAAPKAPEAPEAKKAEDSILEVEDDALVLI